MSKDLSGTQSTFSRRCSERISAIFHLRQPQRPVMPVVTISLVLTVLVGTADFATGEELDIAVLYLLPIAYGIWFGRLWIGLSTASLAAIVHFVENEMSHQWGHAAIPYWNASVTWLFFVAAAVILFRLKTTIAAKEDLLRARSRLMSVVAHDLRSPLASLDGFAELLGKKYLGPLMPEQLDAVTRIQRSSNKMLCLITDLLDISAIESGRMMLHLTSGALEPVLCDQFSFHEVLAKNKGILLQKNIELAHDAVFDAERIGQLVDNLVANAIKFSPPDGVVTLFARQEEGLVRVGVQDGGPGIAVKDRASVFLPFERGSAQPTAGEISTGLGLMIAQKIAEAHGTSIAIEDAPGGGSIFSFTLPVADLPLAQDNDFGIILVVDDDEDTRLLVCRAARNAGGDPLSFSTAEDATVRLPTLTPAMALLDIQLPGEHGISLAWELRRHYPDLPILVISGGGEGWERDDLADCGVDCLIAKPFSVDSLTQMIRLYLQKGRSLQAPDVPACENEIEVLD